MIKFFLFVLTLVILTSLAQSSEKEFDDYFLRREISHGMLVHLINVGQNCSLHLVDATYPYKYADGRGSSRQKIVGCAPTPEDLDQMDYLFWIQLKSQLFESYDTEYPKHIDMKSTLNIVSHGSMSMLNSHNVAAPMSPSKYEVSGYLKYKKGLKKDVDWKLEGNSDIWNEGDEVSIKHIGTGKYLTATKERYPEDWSSVKNLHEVAGDGKKSQDSRWKVVFKRPLTSNEDLGRLFDDELYGEATVVGRNSETEIKNNTQASMSDLQDLHAKEVNLLDYFKTENHLEIVSKELELDGFSQESVLNSNVLHPIDSYNLIKRTSRTWPRIFEKLGENVQENEKLDQFSKYFLDWSKIRVAVAIGILNIHKFYDLNPADLLNGVLEDKFNNKTYISSTNLGIGDAKLFAEVAENEKNLIGAIQWLSLFPKLKSSKRYKNLVKHHDDLVNYEPELAIQSHIRTSLDPVKETVFKESPMRKMMEIHKKQCPPFVGEFEMSCPNKCIEYGRDDETNKLCQGDTSQRSEARNINVTCEHLHFHDPFTRLGPFKFETSNNEGNFVAQVHDLMSETELEEMKSKAKGRMKATPYTIGEFTEEVSYKRSSKIVYVTERNDDLAARLTRRLERALAMTIYSPDYRYCAENYQLMNYGFGGLISLHLDGTKNQFDMSIGGGRFTTAMIYLSTPEAGGFTVFPQLGLFFTPRAGSLLYWNLRRTDSDYDPRMHHLGCPVLYGDKWILNKWIRASAQMNTFKCFSPKTSNYPSNLEMVRRYGRHPNISSTQV